VHDLGFPFSSHFYPGNIERRSSVTSVIIPGLRDARFSGGSKGERKVARRRGGGPKGSPFFRGGYPRERKRPSLFARVSRPFRASGWVISSARYRSSIERRGGPATPMARPGRFVCRRRPAAGVIPGSFPPSFSLSLFLSLSLIGNVDGGAEAESTYVLSDRPFGTVRVRPRAT